MNIELTKGIGGMVRGLGGFGGFFFPFLSTLGLGAASYLSLTIWYISPFAQSRATSTAVFSGRKTIWKYWHKNIFWGHRTWKTRIRSLNRHFKRFMRFNAVTFLNCVLKSCVKHLVCKAAFFAENILHTFSKKFLKHKHLQDVEDFYPRLKIIPKSAGTLHYLWLRKQVLF